MAAACNLTFCVVGRDARQLAAARALQNSGYTVLGAEGAGQADYILLPMPMDAEAADLARILRAARPGTLALGGRISEPVRKAAQAAGVELVDYFLRPELACLNAVPTAEGCLALLMQLRQRRNAGLFGAGRRCCIQAGAQAARLDGNRPGGGAGWVCFAHHRARQL